MQVRDLIAALQAFDPRDKVSVLVIRDYGRDYEEDAEPVGSVERDNPSGTIVIKPE